MKVILTNHPKEITEDVFRAGFEVCPGERPRFIPVSPAPNALPNKCIFNALREEKLGRGKCMLGWKILTWPRVLAQFVGHAVLELEGELVCVTPDLYGAESILFIPDDSIEFDPSDRMARMPTKYAGFASTKMIDRFILVQERMKELEGLIPPSSDPVSVTGRLAQDILKLRKWERALILGISLDRLRADDRCICDSGVRFGKCCQSGMLREKGLLGAS